MIWKEVSVFFFCILHLTTCFTPPPEADENGDSDVNNQTDMVEPTQPTLPDLDQYIVDISVDPYSDYSVAVKWIIPKALDNFTNYFEYQIFCWQSSGDGKAIFQKDNVTKIPVNITGLSAGVPYECTVSFKNLLIPDDQSFDVIETTDVMFFSRELEPLHDVSVTNLKVTMGDGKTVVLSWREPSYSEVRGFPHYRIVVYEGELDREQSAAAFLSALEQLNVVHNITLRGVSSTTISGIDPKKSYHIRMQVFNSAGESGWTYPKTIACNTCHHSKKSAADGGYLTSGDIAGLVIGFLLIITMVVVSAILLAVIYGSYKRKLRYAHAANEREPIVVRDNQNDDLEDFAEA